MMSVHIIVTFNIIYIFTHIQYLNILRNLLDFAEVGEGIDFDKGLLETECIEEREEVLEELDMYEKNLHTQGVLQVGKTEQDAENLAIELLAMRLVCNFGRHL